MKKRVITASIIIALVALFVAGKFLYSGVTDIAIGVVAILACIECSNLFNIMGRKNLTRVVCFYPVLFYFILVIAQEFGNFGLALLFGELIGLVFWAILLLVFVIFERKAQPDIDLKSKFANSFLLAIYPGLFVSTLFVVNNFELIKGNVTTAPWLSFMILITILLVTSLTDTFAFFVGRTVKGPKVAPKISPNKTWSGCIGGLIGGMLGAFVVYILYHNIGTLNAILVAFNLNWWIFLLIGLFGSIVAQFGDFFESYIKRLAGVKDSSNLLPGHGGILDRIDSIMFSTVFLTIIFLIIL